MKLSTTVFLLFVALLVPAGLSAQYRTEMTVARDGSGDFTSIQAAIDAARSFPDRTITIFIKDGVYREKVKVHAWNTRLTLIGESREGTVITYDDHFDKIGRGRNSTFHTYTLLVEGNDFRAENLTVRNTAGPVGQAIALSVNADRCAFVNCDIRGHQDTLYLAGEGARQYFANCYIEGATDFIFGGATVVFESCRIHALADSYITAASTPGGEAFGFVFLNCKLTAAGGVTQVYLGRPWRPHARTVFIRCQLGGHIRPGGWHNWNDTAREATAFYAEYQSAGPGAAPARRVRWSRQLRRKEARGYSVRTVFAGWQPSPAGE